MSPRSLNRSSGRNKTENGTLFYKRDWLGTGIQMRRREFITLLGGTVLPLSVWSLAARGEEASLQRRIGVLWHAASAEEEAVYLGALREGLADLGYVEGRNIVLENRFPAEQWERFISLAAELVELKPDMLVAVSRPAAIAAQRATTTIPIIFSVVPDPVGSKLVVSLARPGGNITGLSNMALDLSAKRIEFLKEMVGGLSRVALLVNAGDEEGARRYVEESQVAARPLGITIVPVEVRGLGEIPRAFSMIDQLNVNGVVGTADSLFTVERKNIIQLALERHLPTMMHSRETVAAGALMSYAPSYVQILRRTAVYVDKILKGVRPADLPVEQPTKFELVINLKTAAALGLTVPPTLLSRADEVIE
jgi:putative ABC transport system substrate-binding protein